MIHLRFYALKSDLQLSGNCNSTAQVSATAQLVAGGAAVLGGPGSMPGGLGSETRSVVDSNDDMKMNNNENTIKLEWLRYWER